jgi:hypothetical protein
MSPRPHEGPAEEGLSSSLLRVVHDPQRVECLRQVLSGFCHRWRNSLNGVKMSLYLFRREARGAVPGCWGELESIYHQVEHLFDHLQTIYRPMVITRVRSPLDQLLGDHLPKWRAWYESRGRLVHLDAPDREVLGDFDPAQLGMGLDALAAWRAEACDAQRQTRVGWEARGGSIEIQWEEIADDGPFMPPEEPDGLETGSRFASVRRLDTLALPLLARVIAAHGGRLHHSYDPGLCVQLRWPQFEP